MSRVLGVDCGTSRVGLALSDPLRVGATPHSVVARANALDVITRLIGDQDVGLVVVGLPIGLSGGEGHSAEDARNLAAMIERHTGVDIVLVDERFTSRMAESALVESGMKRRRRRQTVDKVAAAIILQSYLDTHK